MFNKLKNILFEEEEIVEEPIIEEKKELIRESGFNIPKIRKEEKIEETSEYKFEDETDRELFQSEKTFNFPEFDEDEFEDFLPRKEEVKKAEVEKPRISDISIDYKREEPRRDQNVRKTNYTSTRVLNPRKEELIERKTFKPSPVISPVYGVLDKNYKKEDVVTREEKELKKGKLDVDSVRKKAFGALEEDLEKTISKKSKELFNEIEEAQKIEIVEEPKAIEEIINTKVIEESKLINEAEELEKELDNLLEDVVEEEIDVTKEMEIPSRTELNDYENISDDEEVIEETIDEEDEDIFSKITGIEESEEIDPEIEEEYDDEEESDLFDLIDSMYEDREDED